MKILVTGGAGFIGSHAAEFYANKGHSVVVLDNLSRSKLLDSEIGDSLYNWKRLKTNKNVTLIEDDVRNSKAVDAAAKGADAIIHTAAQVAVTTSLVDPRTDFEINTIGTYNVLEAARKNNSSVIFTSTNKVYGDNVNSIPIESNSSRYAFAKSHSNGVHEAFNIDHTHHSPYGASKLAADLYVQEYSHTYRLKNAVFRMSCIYGDNQFGVEDQGWVAWFTIATLLNKGITIYGDGKQVRDILYVDDLISLMDLFINGKVKHAVINVGGGSKNTISLLELLKVLKEITGKESKLSYSDWRQADQKVYISDISKAKKLFGWEPRIGPQEGIKKLAAWATDYF